MWNTLVSWIEQNGGYVHPSLVIRQESFTLDKVDKTAATNSSNEASDSYHDSDCRNRGLYTSSSIDVNEMIVRIPMSCTIHGLDMPSEYDVHDDRKTNYSSTDNDVSVTATTNSTTTTTTTATASSWLRCLAALMKEMFGDDESISQTTTTTSTKGVVMRTKQPYIASLPKMYETLYQWDTNEIQEYLAGTRLPGVPSLTSPNSSSSNGTTSAMIDPIRLIRQQYNSTIRSYLKYCNIIHNDNHAKTNYTNIDDDEDVWFQRFLLCCQIMSTRSFYMNAKTTTNSVSQNDEEYNGPYLIPIIDLINHADHSHHDTSDIQNTATANSKLEMILSNSTSDSKNNANVFVMRTTRSIVSQQRQQQLRTQSHDNEGQSTSLSPYVEILHSYDSSNNQLSSYQFLSSFGFIPINRMVTVVAQYQSISLLNSSSTTHTHHTSTQISRSPYSVILYKQEIWESCWYLIESGFTQKLLKSIQEKNHALKQEYKEEEEEEEEEADDEYIETWKIVLDKNRTADWISDSLVITLSAIEDEDDNKRNTTLLSDELVTVACIPFLPTCAYSEMFVSTAAGSATSTLFDSSILEDYFLGQLVGAALLRAIQQRLLLYHPIKDSTIRRLMPTFDVQENRIEDSKNKRCPEDIDLPLLSELIRHMRKTKYDGATTEVKGHRHRLAYGVTIRLEEKVTLKALANAVLLTLGNFDTQLVDYDGDAVNDHNNDYETGARTKKHKTAL